MMVFDQYGLPREHNHLWYDKSHGFWDFPTWWENDDGGFNPALPLMRVFAEEQFGTTFAKALDFGEPGNRLYIGSLFQSPDESKRVAMFMSAGSPDGKVPLKVTGGDKLHVVSAFGVEEDLPIRDGGAVLPVPELPVYVELAKGQTIRVVPTDWGRNLARDEGVTAVAANPPAPPKNPNDTNQKITAEKNVVSKLINGEQEELVLCAAAGPSPVDGQCCGVSHLGGNPFACPRGGGPRGCLCRSALAEPGHAAGLRASVRARRPMGDDRARQGADPHVVRLHAAYADQRG